MQFAPEPAKNEQPLRGLNWTDWSPGVGGAIELSEADYARLLSGSSLPEPVGTCIPAPEVPTDLAGLDLSLQTVHELAIKHLYLQGPLTPLELHRELRLTAVVLNDLLLSLRSFQLIDWSPIDALPAGDSPLQLLPSGQVAARHALGRCRYVGPLPVSLTQYVQQCRQQSLTEPRWQPEQLHSLLQTRCVLNRRTSEQLGMLLNSGLSALLYGPSGSGKTFISKQLLELVSELPGIYLPYAIQAGGEIIPVYDPRLHQCLPVTPPQNGENCDPRWLLIRRPVLYRSLLQSWPNDATGDQLPAGLTYRDLFSLNGGLLVLDDLDRSQPSPRNWLRLGQLLLEERRLTSLPGQRAEWSIPLDLLVVVTTGDLQSDSLSASLRRRFARRIELTEPEYEEFRELFRRAARGRGLRVTDEAISRVWQMFQDRQQLPTAADPGELVDELISFCRFHRERVELSEGALALAFKRRWPESNFRAAG